MSETSHPVDQIELDRLVDGELTEADRKQLLIELENSTDGWRRCALTFVEAQAWSADFREIVSEPSPRAMTENDAPPRRQTGSGWATTIVALTVSFLFGGIVTFAFQSSPLSDQHSSIAEQRPTFDSHPATENLIETPQFDVAVTERANVEVMPLELPLLDPSHDDLYQMVGSRRPVIPQHIRQSLERIGHQVSEQRSLYYVSLPDGREAVLPVEDVNVRFVGLTPFQ